MKQRIIIMMSYSHKLFMATFLLDSFSAIERPSSRSKAVVCQDIHVDIFQNISIIGERNTVSQVFSIMNPNVPLFCL